MLLMPKTLATLYRFCFRFDFRIHRGALFDFLACHSRPSGHDATVLGQYR